MWTPVLYCLLSAATFIVPAESEGNGASLLDSQIIDFKKNVHRILEGSRIRKKRQLGQIGDPSDHRLRFDSVTPVDLPYLSDYNLTTWISLRYQHTDQVLIGTQQGHLVLFQVSDQGMTAETVALSEEGDIAVKAAAFSDGNEQWFCVLHSSNETYYYIQMYQLVGRGLEKRQPISLKGQSDFQLITLRGVHYLVVATSQAYKENTVQGMSHEASVVLYRWIKTQFDEIASRKTYGARSLACWIRGGSIYIAVGQEKNDEDNYHVGSPIFFYNSKEANRLVLWQMLKTTGPTKVKHFYVAGSHYLIFIGRKDAVIYWWSNGQFLEWQTLEGTAYASDLEILSLEAEVAIVIGLKKEALFFTLDGSGFYISTVPVSFEGSTLTSLHFMYSGKAYYALALFAETQSRQSIWRMGLGSVYMPSVNVLDPFQQCLVDAQDLLQERESVLSAITADLGRVWLKGSNQTISSKVVVKGKVTSPLIVKAKDIIIIRHTKLPDASMGLLINELIHTKDAMDEVKGELDGVVYKSTRQEIRGLKYFSDLIYVPSLTMDSVERETSINDVSLEKLEKSALRKVGNQFFPNTILIYHIHADTVNAGTLNGISTDDLLLLHGKQVVSGDLMFSNVKGSNLSTHTINYIPVEDIVTTKHSQSIRDLKVFSKLQSDAIDVEGEINGANLEDAVKKITLVSDFNQHGQLTFEKPLNIQGNLFLAGQINNVFDLSKLMSESVTTGTQQDLTGLYRFKANTTIIGDVVAGTINRVSTGNLLTLSSDQDIYSDVSFTAPLTVKGKLLPDFVNGVHLGDQVIRKLSPQEFVSGRKIFVEDIFADFVDMADYVTLDSVDPSALGEDIVHHKQGVVKSNSTSFKNVIVRGNLTSLKGINGYEVTDLADLVWLKSVPQKITSPLVAQKLDFRHNLNVNTVNGYDLDEDIVHSYLDEVIPSTKTFRNKIVIQNELKTTENGTINGFDPRSFKIELDRYKDEESTIHGKKTLMSLEVLGDLRVENLNDIPLSHIMQPHARQTVYGPVDFESEITSVSGDMSANDLSFNNVNGQNIEKYYNSAIVANDPKRPITKKFAHLKGSHLSIPTGSLVNGVSIDDMVHRVVTLNSPQQIFAEKSFEDVKFEKFINVSTLNGLDFSKYVRDVVFTDEPSVVSNKIFSKVDSTSAAVGGINGIKIEDVAANVFYKSDDNEVTAPFILKGDVDISDLIANSTLDGVEMKDLILLKKDQQLGPAFFLANVTVDGDLLVTGELNGCNLSEVASKVIYRNKPKQVITEQISVQTIVVNGNVHFEDAGGENIIEHVKNFITASDDQEITSDVVINANWAVENLHLNAHTGSSKIAEIMKDAVRHSLSQLIQGPKVFKNVNASILIGGDIFANEVNAVNLQQLYETAVRKNVYQEIKSEKIFAQLNADVVTAKGYLNGLLLPNDVVRTDTSEHISHPTYFMSDVFVTTDVVVRGLIDGVNIDELIANRVALSGDQNITAQLTFLNEVVVLDKMKVDGTINEIVLELVAKVHSDQPIQGYKLFAQLDVSGAVSATTVGGYDVSKLASKIVQNNNEDFINSVQVFEKPIISKSLSVEWLNNISIQRLKDTFEFAMNSINTLLSYLKDFTSSLQKQLSYQLSATQEQVSRFAYFILVQEIDMGPTTRILNGYAQRLISRDLSHSLVMWTTQKHCIYMEKCCHLDFSYWMTVQKNGIVMVDATPEPGRYYPISDPVPSIYERDFFVWTNKTDVQSQWCKEKNSRTYLASYRNDGSLEVSIDLEEAPLSDIKTFRHGHRFAVASFYYENTENTYSSTVVYIYNELHQQWSKHQTIHSLEVLSLDVIDYTNGYEDEILLALGTGTDTLSYSTVYKWNNKEHLFEVFQSIPSYHVASTLWIRKGNELLLAMSSVNHWPGKHHDCAETTSGGAINIYAYKEKLHWIQSISASGIISMATFTVEGELFLAAASSEHQMIYIYKWKGYSAFVEIQAMFVGEVKHISVYAIDDDVYMTAALSSGPSKILKLVRKGKHVTANILTSELVNDESSKETKLITGC